MIKSDDPAALPITIIGSGSLGSLLAAFLEPHSRVRMLSHWPEQIAAIQAHGLLCLHQDGSQSEHRFTIVSDPRELQPVQLALVCVKSYQTARAAFELAPLLAVDGLAITLQNGLGNLEILAAALGRTRVAQGVTAQGATMIEPGLVRHAGHGLTYIATIPGKETIIQEFSDLLNIAGMAAELTIDVRSLQWGKLVVNAGINPLTAILGVPNGFLAVNEQARQIMCAAAEETASVAAALGIKLPYAEACEQVTNVARSTAENISSMLQDVLRGAPTEINAINGAVAERGRRLGLLTPVNDLLWREVTAMSSQTAALSSPNTESKLQDLSAQLL